jgi:hypothetical protein
MQLIKQILAIVAAAMARIVSAGTWVKEFGIWVFRGGPMPSFAGVAPAVAAAVGVTTRTLATEKAVKTVAKVGLEIATLPLDILAQGAGRNRQQQQQADEPTEDDNSREKKRELRYAMMAEMMRTKSRAMGGDWRSHKFKGSPQIDAPEVNDPTEAPAFRM